MTLLRITWNAASSWCEKRRDASPHCSTQAFVTLCLPLIHPKQPDLRSSRQNCGWRKRIDYKTFNSLFSKMRQMEYQFAIVLAAFAFRVHLSTTRRIASVKDSKSIGLRMNSLAPS
jgi:hypothetical protein